MKGASDLLAGGRKQAPLRGGRKKAGSYNSIRSIEREYFNQDFRKFVFNYNRAAHKINPKIIKKSNNTCLHNIPEFPTTLCNAGSFKVENACKLCPKGWYSQGFQQETCQQAFPN